MSIIIYHSFRLVFGTLYPAYSSYKAVKTKNVKEYVKWMMYWIVFAFFTCVETFADIFIAWLPFYYELKIIFVLWMLSPATKGASILYRKFVHPQLAKREKEIDTYIAKASDQGYTALLSIGSRGFNYATNVVLSTAVKGQAKIADHLRKSYSLNDLSGGTEQQKLRDDEVDLDDETDNRLIAESYQREMQEKADSEERRLRKNRLSYPAAGEIIEEEEDDSEAENLKERRSTRHSNKEELSSYSAPNTPKKEPTSELMSRYLYPNRLGRSFSTPTTTTESSSLGSWRTRPMFSSSSSYTGTTSSSSSYSSRWK